MSAMAPEFVALFYALAFVAFVLAAFNVSTKRISFVAAGLAAWIFPMLWNAVAAL